MRPELLGSKFLFFFLLSLLVPVQGVAEPANVLSVDDAIIEEVVVTATRREQSLQDVPIAITAVSGEQLQQQGVQDLTTFAAVSSGFQMNTSDRAGSNATFRLRGIGTTGNNTGLESAVGVFLDGIYLSRPGIALADLVDVEQIEVLRGPQGTLFGRNTSAGAINIKTKLPDLHEIEGFANLTTGNYDLLNVQAGVNVPLVDNVLGFRLSGAYRERDGYLVGADDYETYDRDRYLLRGQLYWDGGSAGTLRLIGDYAELDEQCCDAVVLQDGPGPFGDPLGNGGITHVGSGALEDLDANSRDFDQPVEQWGISAEYQVDLPFGTLTYIGSYREFEEQTARSTDSSTLAVFTVGATPQAQALSGDDAGNFGVDFTEFETVTHEVRLQGVAFNDRVDWLVGLYYSDEEIEETRSLTLLSDYQLAISNAFFGQALGTFNFLNFASAGVEATGDFSSGDYTQSGESFSIFTHNIISLADDWELTVGLRYVDESKDNTYIQADGDHNACFSTYDNIANIAALSPDLVAPAVIFNCIVFAGPTFDPNDSNDPLASLVGTPAEPFLGLLGQEYDSEFEDDEFTYTIKLGHALNDNVNLFAGYSRGFKSGGANLDPSAAAGGGDPTFDSETVDAFEIGIKSQFWEGRARLNATAFHMIMNDFQVLQFDGIRLLTFNVEEALSTGIEIEQTTQWNSYFSTHFDMTYADTRYPNDCATDNTADPGFLEPALRLCGFQLTNAPEWTIIGAANFELPVFDGTASFFANVSARYESKRRTTTQAVPAIGAARFPFDFQKDNTKVNLRIGLAAQDESWIVELWGTNITDERTYNVSSGTPFRGDQSFWVFVQDPRLYGLTLRTRF